MSASLFSQSRSYSIEMFPSNFCRRSSRRFMTLMNAQVVSFVWFGSWRRIARNQAHRPSNHLEPHLLKFWTVPDGLDMTEAIVEHAAFAVVACPDHGKIPVRSLHAFAGQFEFVRVETQQDTHILSGEILDLVNLVLQLEGGGEIPHARKGRIFNQERCLEHAP